MGIFKAVLGPIEFLNTRLLQIGRAVGILAIAGMVVVILLQIFFRYALNNALAWPDEAARFLMLWMTGLMAPSAYRSGGFVAIDMLSRFLSPILARGLMLLLLCLSIGVLIVGLRIGWSEVTGFGGRFATASLSLPTSLDLSSWMRVPRSWMMTSLLVGTALLILVNVELILRSLCARPVFDASQPTAQQDLGSI